MKTTLYLSLLSISICLSGCFAPVNLNYDNARLLPSGEWKIAAAGSQYFDPEDELNVNFGFSAAHGLNDDLTLHARYEHLNYAHINKDLAETSLSGSDLNYLEIGAKLPLVRDRLAIDIPIGIYFNTGTPIGVADPRLIFTHRFNDQVEINTVGKIHIFSGTYLWASMVGISAGLALSTDLNRWAIRPEVGFDGFVSWGIGVECYLR